MSIPDPAVREQLRALSSDPYAQAVLNRVEGGSFGPARCAVDDPNSILPLLEDIYTNEEKDTGAWSSFSVRVRPFQAGEAHFL